MPKQDHVTRFIRVLKKTHQIIIPFKDSNPGFKDAEFHVDLAIKSLENYQGKPSQFARKPPPVSPPSRIDSKEKYSLGGNHYSNPANNYSNYTWVKEHYRKGNLVRGHWRKKTK